MSLKVTGTYISILPKWYALSFLFIRCTGMLFSSSSPCTMAASEKLRILTSKCHLFISTDCFLVSIFLSFSFLLTSHLLFHYVLILFNPPKYLSSLLFFTSTILSSLFFLNIILFIYFYLQVSYESTFLLFCNLIFSFLPLHHFIYSFISL